MLKEVLSLNGISKLTKQQQMTILGGGKTGNECGPYSNPHCSGACTGQEVCAGWYDENETVCGWFCADPGGIN